MLDGTRKASSRNRYRWADRFPQTKSELPERKFKRAKAIAATCSVDSRSAETLRKSRPQMQSKSFNSGIAGKASNGKWREKSDKRDMFCLVRDAFRVAARKTSDVLGTAWAFIGAVSVIVIWGFTGRLFHYSDTWQLIINTGTTIITFLMVFLIQNTQNRDSKAIQLKLDEIIRSLSGARNHLIDLETLSDEDLQKLQDEFRRLRRLSESGTAPESKVSRGSN